jgi:hypothetical protein
MHMYADTVACICKGVVPLGQFADLAHISSVF